MGMTKACYDEIVATSITGSNADRGDRQHSFSVPTRFHAETSSKPDKPRTVNIFLAWVADTWVWSLVDFSRLVRFQVVSRDEPWSTADLLPASPVLHLHLKFLLPLHLTLQQAWLPLWAAFATGPDWNTETNDALQLTDEWRERVLATTRVSTKSILEILGSADEPCFFAFGRHTANDFLHTVGIFPGATAIFVCRNNSRYILFKMGIVSYMSTWVSHSFLDSAGGISNSLNPFAYNYKSFVVYFMHLLVFRRSHAFVPRQLFNLMLRGGLFNPRHVIGMC